MKHCAVILALAVCAAPTFGKNVFFRLNQAGYLPNDRKIVLVISDTALSGGFSVTRIANEKPIFSGILRPDGSKNWGSPQPFTYELDLSAIAKPGRYQITLSESGQTAEVSIGLYPAFQEDLLAFMRQQRCGYNPFLDAVCHLKDGRSFYGPMPDESFIDVTGGWHDAGANSNI